MALKFFLLPAPPGLTSLSEFSTDAYSLAVMWENLNTVNFECLEFYVVTVTNTMTGEVEQVIEQDREQDGITLGK